MTDSEKQFLIKTHAESTAPPRVVRSEPIFSSRPQADGKQELDRQVLHDLRSPLNQILGYSEILEELARDEQREDVANDIAKIRAAGNKLLNVIDSRFVVADSDTPPPAEPAEAADARVERRRSALLPVPSPPPTEDWSQEPARILVVDDIEANRDVLARRLRKHQHEVELAGDGTEALKKIQEQPFDIVLLDIMMPGINGYDVLQKMKADPVMCHIPVIVISALGEMESIVKAIELGAEDYLPKPFNPTLLKARVNACLGKKRAHDREAELFAQLEENFARLNALERQREDMMHMIVHDLRSPLSANLAGIEMAEMVGPLEPQQKECLAIAMRSGHNLLGLINDLLDISKMEGGAFKLEYSSLRVEHLVALALEQITPLLADKQLELKRSFAPDLPSLEADESKLQRVFVNLLSNAVKFTPRNGSITIEVAVNEDRMLFAIRDTGEGIPPEAIGQIFEKFSQVETRKSGRQMSTGLGLTFCKKAVEAHRGSIWVESTPGNGSTFYFTVPLSAHE